MTTYGTDLRMGTSPRGNTATLPRTQGSLNRTTKTFPGGKSEIKPFRQATNKSPTVAPKSPSSDSTAQTLGKAAKGVAGIGKKTLGKISPGIGINSKGDIDIGVRAGGAGISLSTKGEISLGIGIGQVTFDPKNLNVGKVELGFGVASSEATQDGCTITVTDRIMGKIVNQYTRKADDCVEPEPTPTPTPIPTPKPTPQPGQSSYKRSSSKTSNPPGSGGMILTAITRFSFKPDSRYYQNYHNETPVPVTNSWDDTYPPIIKGIGGDYYKIEETTTHSYSFVFKWYKLIGNVYDGGYYEEKIVTASGSVEYNKITYSYADPPRNSNDIIFQFTEQENTIGGISGELRDGIFTISVTYPGSTVTGFNYIATTVNGETRDIDDYSYTGYGSLFTGIRKHSVDITLTPVNSNYSPKPRELSSTPTPKPRELMADDNCNCELLEDIYDMLGGEDFFKDGLEIPNHLFIPGGTGETKALTYNALLNLMFRTLDHRTVGEVEVSIKDNNIMKEGDQGLTMKLVNATAATGKILELSQKQDSDLTAVLNLLMRLSWISVQILKVVNIGSEATKTIVSFFAIPVKEKVINVDIPVDPSLGGKIGFDPKKPSEDQLIKILDLDDPQKTISIFDKFMNNSKIPVKVKQFIGDRSGGNYWWLMDKNKK
jgi:hypothetical protein